MDSVVQRFSHVENARRIGYLIGGSISGSLTIGEREELDAWVCASDANEKLYGDLTDPEISDQFMEWLAGRDTEAKLAALKTRVDVPAKRKFLHWWYYAGAASLLLLAGLIWFFSRDTHNEVSVPVTAATEDIPAGFAQAELRLPDGRVIRPADVKDTVIDGIAIYDGVVRFDRESGDTAARYELVIPRKGYYQLQLPDGSKVWLNSASSIRFPGQFGKDGRIVRVTGECFFEVAKDAGRPFIAEHGERQIVATGTAFNINCFDSTVTLTEGVVTIRERGRAIKLRPGQQLGSGWSVKFEDARRVTAWTRNEFSFKDEKLEQIIPVLERWYDCRIHCGKGPDFHYNGTIERGLSISHVLDLLAGTGHFSFRIEGREVYITKFGL